jgi:hypothetical protein
MLYLAQVHTKDQENGVILRLLACQRAEHSWSRVEEEDVPLAEVAVEFGEGAIVLAEVSSSRQVKSVQDGKSWLLGIVEQYLTTGMSPELLQEEVQRAEQWRQSLTLQSQELGRRTLELEARRDQIQDLEENLKQEKQLLEVEKRQIQAWAAELKTDLPALQPNSNV